MHIFSLYPMAVEPRMNATMVSVGFGGAESDVEAFAHGYVALQLFNTDCKCVLKVNWRASYE
jgi:hypothetical protein